MLNNIDDCLEVELSEHFFIQDNDDKNPAFINYDFGQFEVINKIHKDIHFLKIDDCIYKSNDSSRCDCAVFDDKVFCFIELKTCKIKSQKYNRVKADKQLKQTIMKFKNEDIVNGKKLEAYACLTCKTIDEKLTRITNAYSQDVIFEFEEDLDVELQYECIKEFK